MAGDGHDAWIETGQWNDQVRTMTLPYLCEKPAAGTYSGVQVNAVEGCVSSLFSSRNL